MERLNTKAAFEIYVEEIYPHVSPKDNSLRTAISRFRNGNYVSERKMISIIEKHFKPTKFEEVPIEWDRV